MPGTIKAGTIVKERNNRQYILLRDVKLKKKNERVPALPRFRSYTYHPTFVNTNGTTFNYDFRLEKALKKGDWVYYDLDGFITVKCLVTQRLGDEIIMQPRGVGTFITISIFSSRIQVILDPPDIEPIVLVESLYCNKLNNRVEVNGMGGTDYYVVDYEPVTNKYLLCQSPGRPWSAEWKDPSDFRTVYEPSDKFTCNWKQIGVLKFDAYDTGINHIDLIKEDVVPNAIWHKLFMHSINHFATKYSSDYDIYTILLWLEHHRPYWKNKSFNLQNFNYWETLTHQALERNSDRETIDYLTKACSLNRFELNKSIRIKEKLQSMPLFKTKLRKNGSRFTVDVLVPENATYRSIGMSKVFLYNYVSKVLWHLSNKPVSCSWLESRQSVFSLPIVMDEVIMKIPLKPFQQKVIRVMRENEKNKNIRSLMTLNTRSGVNFNAITSFWDISVSAGGGILSLPTGTGKTICTLGLIQKTKCEGPTLVVLPLTLMDQWILETQKFTDLAWGEMHGRKNTSENKDIVFTTYGTVSSKYGKEQEHSIWGVWKRVVFDESHQFKSQDSKIVRACTNICADNRWCLSATPYRQGSFNNLHAQLSMLNVCPFEYQKNMFTHLLYQETPHTQWIMSQISSLIINPNINNLNIPQSIEHRITVPNQHRELYSILYQIIRNKVRQLMDYGCGSKHQQLMSWMNYVSVCASDPSMVPLELWGTPCDNSDFCITNIDDLSSSLSNKTGFANEVVKTLSNLEETTCCLCLETLTRPVITDCLHMFCHDCIKRSLEFNRKCPNCRKYLSDNSFKEITASTETSTVDGFTYVYNTLGRKVKIPEQTMNLLNKTSQNNKLSELKRIINERKKIVVFSQFNRILESMSSQFDCAIITGRSTRSQRKKNIEKFKTGETNLFFLSTKVADVGINLTEADTLVFLEPGLESAVKTQTLGRVQRIGQNKQVHVYTLITGDTIETIITPQREILEQKINKLMLSSDYSKSYKVRQKKHFNMDYILNLLS